jgi:hypothetical protein
MNMPARLFAAIAFLAILSGCSGITTNYPVGISGGVQTDARLLGGWRVVETNNKQVRNAEGEGYIFFLPRKGGGYTGVWMAWSRPPAAKPDMALFDIITGRIGATGFINARLVDQNEKPVDAKDPGYWPGLYRFDQNGRLHIFIFSDQGIKLAESAVQNHRLAGASDEQSAGKDSSGKNNKNTNVHITADPKLLDIYFAANAPLIFTDPIYTFERVN